MATRRTRKAIETEQASVFADTYGTGYEPRRWKGFKWAWPGYVPEWLHDEIPPSHNVDDEEHDLNESLCWTVIAPSGAFGVKPPAGYRIVHTSGCGERECPECGPGTGNEEAREKCKFCEGNGHIYWGEECLLVVFAKNVKPKPFKKPKASEVASDLWGVVQEAKKYDREEITEHGSDEPGIDVRLQVYPDGQWALRTGDSSYDQDHRGYWGSGSVSPDMKRGDCKELAKDLIDQAEEAYAYDHPSVT